MSSCRSVKVVVHTRCPKNSVTLYKIINFRSKYRINTHTQKKPQQEESIIVDVLYLDLEDLGPKRRSLQIVLKTKRTLCSPKGFICLLIQEYRHKKRWFACCSKSSYTKSDGLLVVPKVSTQKEMVCFLFQEYRHKKRWFACCSKSIYTKSDSLLVVPRVSTQQAMVCLLFQGYLHK